jgi:hypothetical protein
MFISSIDVSTPSPSSIDAMHPSPRDTLERLNYPRSFYGRSSRGDLSIKPTIPHHLKILTSSPSFSFPASW